MQLDEWQTKNLNRSATAFPECDDWSLNDWATALGGEVGEVQNALKKIRRKGKGFPMSGEEREHVAEEIGDSLSYLAILAGKIGVSLETCADLAWNKVNKRKGYNG